MGFILAIIRAITAGANVFSKEREIANRPDMVKTATGNEIQKVKDALTQAEQVLADPQATPAQHAEALRQIRLAHS